MSLISNFSLLIILWANVAREYLPQLPKIQHSFLAREVFSLTSSDVHFDEIISPSQEKIEIASYVDVSIHYMWKEPHAKEYS